MLEDEEELTQGGTSQALTKSRKHYAQMDTSLQKQKVWPVAINKVL